MTVRQVAEYLQLNEKKIYALATKEKIPATKVTGKWMFPRELVDRWMLESAHGGVFTDRLVIAGSEDPLLYRTLLRLSNSMQSHALVSYTGTGTRLGFGLAFVELGWEALDFAVRRDVYFRNIFQAFMEYLRSPVILKKPDS